MTQDEPTVFFCVPSLRRLGIAIQKQKAEGVILYRIAGDDPFCPPQIRKDDNRVDSIVVFYKGGELFRAFGTAVSA